MCVCVSVSGSPALTSRRRGSNVLQSRWLHSESNSMKKGTNFRFFFVQFVVNISFNVYLIEVKEALAFFKDHTESFDHVKPLLVRGISNTYANYNCYTTPSLYPFYTIFKI